MLENGATILAPVEVIAPLYCYAAANGNLKKIQHLYRGGANINASDYDGRTVGHLACSRGHLNIV